MRNVHQRMIAAPAVQVGALLDELGSDRDRLWPSPAWPPIRFDRPLAVGADGGHGDVRYVVSGYEPGRRVECRFLPVTGLTGFHALEVEPIDGNSCLLRHELVGQPRGRMRLVMPLVVRWLHDAVLEDLLDNAERAVTGTVARPYRYSPWVRLLRWVSGPRARGTEIPVDARLIRAELPGADYSDAYSIMVPAGVSADPSTWTAALLSGLPRLGRSEHEVLLGADERHLSYRAGVHIGASGKRVIVTVSTVVRLHARAGRVYFAVVRRAHPFVVRFLLRRAALRLAGEPASFMPVPG